MQKEDYNTMKTLQEILETDLRKEMTKINTAGTINPTQVETLNDAVCLMLKLKEYEQWMNSEEGQNRMEKMYSYNTAPMSNSPYYNVSNMHSWNAMPMNQWPNMNYGYYNTQPSNHSTKDRMISRLEDMMGDAKNDYEAKMIHDAITYIQNN